MNDDNIGNKHKKLKTNNSFEAFPQNLRRLIFSIPQASLTAENATDGGKLWNHIRISTHVKINYEHNPY